jgi:histidinol-phosphate phosphatase family protein
MGIGAMSRPAVFLDRDGVLVEEIFYSSTGEREAPLSAEDVRLLPGAAEALKRLADAGFALVAISNQGAYAKGKTTLRALWLAHERFLALLAEQGVRLDGCHYSWGHPDGTVPHFSGPSLDRKPGPYNIFIAAAQLDLDLSRSWMVGDRDTDVACAKAAGVQPILIAQSGESETGLGGLICAASLREAAGVILESSGHS